MCGELEPFLADKLGTKGPCELSSNTALYLGEFPAERDTFVPSPNSGRKKTCLCSKFISWLSADACEYFIFQLVAYAVNPERPGALLSPGYTECHAAIHSYNRGPGSAYPSSTPPFFAGSPSSALPEVYKDSLYVYLIDMYFEYYFSGQNGTNAASSGMAASTMLTPSAVPARMHSPTRPRYISPLIKQVHQFFLPFFVYPRKTRWFRHS